MVIQGDDDVGIEGNTNLEHYNKQIIPQEEKQMIVDMQNKIKNSVKLGKSNSQFTTSQSQTTNQDIKITKESSTRSGGLKSMLLNHLSTQKKIKDVIDNREFRIVTGADDGHVFFWNIPYDLINEEKERIALELTPGVPNRRGLSMKKSNSTKLSNIAGSVGFRKIPEFKPKFELFLSGYAQVQNIVINGDYLITLDNDSTTSIFKCEIDKPIYAPSKPNPSEVTNEKTKSSPINLPSVGPINTASSGSRRQGGFKVGWNKRATGDDDTENEEMEMSPGKEVGKETQLVSEEDEKMDEGINVPQF
jgi:hypothetical protein